MQLGDTPSDGPCVLGPFAPPTKLAGPIQSVADDWFPGDTLGGTMLVVSSYRAPSQLTDLWYATRPDTASDFGTPVMITELATAGYEGGPSVTADGLDMIFYGDGAGYDLFESQRASTSDPWGPRTVVNVSTANQEQGGSLSQDGLRIVWAANRPDSLGFLDLYEARRPTRSSPFGNPDHLVNLSSAVDEDSPTLSADALEIFFVSKRSGGPGMYDVYTARRSSVLDPFSAPTLVPQLSTAFDEDGLRLSADGRSLYMNYDTLTGGGRNADVWVATRTCQ